MIAVVVPERVAWLDGLLARLRALDEVKVFDPSGGLVGRGVALGLHAWARGRAERVMAARFARRRAVDALAARWLPPLTRLVVAPSLGARRTFAAAAARRGVARVLVEDLPGFRQLHDDLDRAARDRPASTFLRRYRAPAPLLARQEAERVLADLLLVRGAFAAETRRALGVPAERVAVLSAPPRVPCPPLHPRNPKRVPNLPRWAPTGEAGLRPTPRAPRAPGGGPRLLLAGLATGRSGVAEALQALEALPDATLLVRPGDGMEPADLLTRPRVRPARPHELAALTGVDVVLAPALCESYPPEVPLAAALGIPVVATRRAAGAVDLARAGAEVPPGDAAALAGAVAQIYGRSSP